MASEFDNVEIPVAPSIFATSLTQCLHYRAVQRDDKPCKICFPKLQIKNNKHYDAEPVIATQQKYVGYGIPSSIPSTIVRGGAGEWLYQACTYLSIPDICSIMLSCHATYKLLTQDAFWHRLYKLHFPKMNTSRDLFTKGVHYWRISYGMEYTLQHCISLYSILQEFDVCSVQRDPPVIADHYNEDDPPITPPLLLYSNKYEQTVDKEKEIKENSENDEQDEEEKPDNQFELPTHLIELYTAHKFFPRDCGIPLLERTIIPFKLHHYAHSTSMFYAMPAWGVELTAHDEHVDAVYSYMFNQILFSAGGAQSYVKLNKIDSFPPTATVRFELLKCLLQFIRDNEFYRPKRLPSYLNNVRGIMEGKIWKTNFVLSKKKHEYEELQLLPMNGCIQIHSPFTTHTYSIVHYHSMNDIILEQDNIEKDQQERDAPIKEKLKKKHAARQQNKIRMKAKKFQQQQHDNHEEQQYSTDSDHDPHEHTDNTQNSSADEHTNTPTKSQNHNNKTDSKHDDWSEATSHYHERKQRHIQEKIQKEEQTPANTTTSTPSSTNSDASNVVLPPGVTRISSWLQPLCDRNGIFIFTRVHNVTHQASTYVIRLSDITPTQIRLYSYDHAPNLCVPSIPTSLAPTSKQQHYECITWNAK